MNVASLQATPQSSYGTSQVPLPERHFGHTENIFTFPIGLSGRTPLDDVLPQGSRQPSEVLSHRQSRRSESAEPELKVPPTKRTRRTFNDEEKARQRLLKKIKGCPVCRRKKSKVRFDTYLKLVFPAAAYLQ